MNKPTKLILHIGSGESESAAIQMALYSGKEQLNAIGVSFWGTNLELAPYRAYEWQDQHVGLYACCTNVDFSNELEEVIEESISREIERGTKLIIWSNQWIEHNSELVSKILKAHKGALDFQIIYYVQNIEENIVSKYVQWGIVHKTYEGPIKSIDEFSSSRVAYTSIERLIRDFRGKVNIRNSSEIRTPIIRDFEKCIGLNDTLIAIDQDYNFNDIYLRYIFNDRCNLESLPFNFNNFTKADRSDKQYKFDDFYSNFKITDNLKDEIYENSEKEIDTLNVLLNENNQKPISKKKSDKLSTIKLSKDTLLSMMLKVVENTADSIDEAVGKERYKDLKLAVVCMQKNEASLLKYWFQYYSRLIPAKNIYVIDNCSDDALTLKILDNMSNAGCNITSSRKDQNVDHKGALVTELVDGISHLYDLILPVDCDEFLYFHGKGNFSNKFTSIFEELSKFLSSPSPIARISKSILNIPNSKNGFFCDAKKVILKSGFRYELDPGFHLYNWDTKSSKFDQSTFYNSQLGLFHLHNKPFELLQKSSIEKLQFRVENFMPDTLKSYAGAGAHLTKYLLMDESEYLKSFPKKDLFGMRWFINTSQLDLPY